jgi:hypothetical protein
MKTLVCFASLFFVAPAIAEPMHFEVKETGGNVADGFKLRVKFTKIPQRSSRNSCAPQSLYQKVVDLTPREVVSAGEFYWGNYFGVAVWRPKSGQVT